MSDKTDVCLECWDDFTGDIFHFDCTGEHVVPREKADELRAWLTGRYWWIVGTRQVLDD